MNWITNFLVKLDRLLNHAMRWIALTCFIALLLILSGVVFVRFVPVASFGWSDEIVEWAFAWMVFMGAAALWRDNEHFRVRWLEDRLKGKTAGKALGLIVEILSIFFIMTMAYYGLKLTMRAHDRSPILELPRHLWYLCIPVAGGIMTGYSIRNIRKGPGGIMYFALYEED
jgi:TRAP-type C4-dicarboxylate transport system permease small subunit